MVKKLQPFRARENFLFFNRASVAKNNCDDSLPLFRGKKIIRK
jgi:hypothetical protein